LKTALLIIDIQNDYFTGGKYPLVNPLEAAQKAYMILQCFREQGGHHIHIQHISLEPDATFFISGDRGTDIHDSVAHFEGEPIVYKHEPNSFLNTNLLELLRGWEIERVVITGMMTHMPLPAPRQIWDFKSLLWKMPVRRAISTMVVQPFRLTWCTKHFLRP